MPNNKRVAIFIDGSNLYYKLKDSKLSIPNTTNFDYFGLCKLLARDRILVSHTYYIGVVKAKPDDKKGEQLRQNQVRLFNNLRKNNFQIKQGYLMKNDGKFHEKGVDVHIAVDILIGAYENLYDIAIVISSDTDLLPAIKKSRELGKQVEYIGFSHAPSFGVMKNVDSTKLLSKDDLQVFVKSKK